MWYKVNEKIDPDKIREFTFNGIAMRKEDGFGRIAVLQKIPDELTISGYTKISSTAPEKVALNVEEEKFVYAILKNIFYSRAGLKTEKMVLRLMQMKETAENNVQTQIGKILNLFENSVYKSEADFKQELSGYLSHMESKRGKEVWHKLRRIGFSYNKKFINVQQLLIDFVNGNTNPVFDKLNRAAEEGIRLGEYRYPDVNEQREAKYNLYRNFFINLFGYFLRIKRGEKDGIQE